MNVLAYPVRDSAVGEPQRFATAKPPLEPGAELTPVAFAQCSSDYDRSVRGAQSSDRQDSSTSTFSTSTLLSTVLQANSLLQPIKQWLNQIEIRTAEQAHTICQTIPAQCPFERDITLFGKRLFHIPPLCKLNPVYEEVVALRFRALCFLADDCGEDISPYITVSSQL